MGERITNVVTRDLARFVICLTLIAGTLVLLIVNRDIPPAIWALDGTAVGWFFGGNTAQITAGPG